MYLVGVLEDDVSALGLLQAGIHDGVQHTPRIGHIQHHLVSQLSRLDLLDTQDLMGLRVNWMLARHIAVGERGGGREGGRGEVGRKERECVITKSLHQQQLVHPSPYTSPSPEFDEAGASQDGAHGPLCDLAAVVLQFRGKHRPSLRVQLLPPVHTPRVLPCTHRGRLAVIFEP